MLSHINMDIDTPMAPPRWCLASARKAYDLPPNQVHSESPVHEVDDAHHTARRNEYEFHRQHVRLPLWISWARRRE